MLEFCVGIAVVFIIFCIISLFTPSKELRENNRRVNEYLRLANEDREKRNNEFYYENKRLHDTYGYEFDPTNLKKSFQERAAIYRYEQIKKDEEIIKKLKKEDTN